MLLSAENLVPYLLDRGLIDPASAVDGGLMVAESTRRHRSFKVLRSAERGLFVKQPRIFDAPSVALLDRESACYWLAQNDPAFAPLRRLVPGLRDYDPARKAFVVDLLPESENLTEYHRRMGAVPAGMGALLGELFGTFHREMVVTDHAARLSSLFPSALPWTLQLPDLDLSSFQSYGPAAMEAVTLARNEPAVRQALAALARSYRRTTLVHCDVKWDNCLVFRDAGDGDLRLNLIDWELADFGDPLWDVGAALQAWLVWWVWSMPLSETLPIERLAERAAVPIEAIRPAVRAFFEAYEEARGLHPSGRRELLSTCLSYAAARLLQTAFEAAVAQPAGRQYYLTLLQLGFNILARPREAAASLLALA